MHKAISLDRAGCISLVIRIHVHHLHLVQLVHPSSTGLMIEGIYHTCTMLFHLQNILLTTISFDCKQNLFPQGVFVTWIITCIYDQHKKFA